MNLEDTALNEPVKKTENKPKFKTPKRQKVVFLNDDNVGAHFVVKALIEVFEKTIAEAEQLTFYIHNNGQGEVYRAIESVVETKVDELENLKSKDREMLSYIVEDIDDGD